MLLYQFHQAFPSNQLHPPASVTSASERKVKILHGLIFKPKADFRLHRMGLSIKMQPGLEELFFCQQAEKHCKKNLTG